MTTLKQLINQSGVIDDWRIIVLPESKDSLKARYAIQYDFHILDDLHDYWHTSTLGFYLSLKSAVWWSKVWFINQEDEIMANIIKNNKLFPTIKGGMIRDKRVTLHLNGQHKVVKMPSGGRNEEPKYRVQIEFTDHQKNAVINTTELMKIVEIHGEETDNWKGKPVVLYAEHGKWFGSWHWAMRVDSEATKRAASQITQTPPNNPKSDEEE